ncbi:hypothetical protein L0Y59_03635, partial [Candidatus Uhrbacteria bacterium]|nr:hypothetical protein [Candidatus Uhrbacteria bacterium]
MNETNPFRDRPSEPPPSSDRRLTSVKEDIGRELDAFAETHRLKSLRDRLRIGLNEAGILAVERTNAKVKDLCRKLAKTDEEAEMIYGNLVDMTVDIQQHGPWEYAAEFKRATSPEIRAWFMLVAAESMGYEKEMDLTDREFVEDVGRIAGILDEANGDPEGFYTKAQEHVLEQAASKIRFGEK